MSTPADIVVAACAEAFELPRRALLARRGGRQAIRARQAAFWLLRNLPPARGRLRSYPEIGRSLGRDHITVLHACRRAEELVCEDPDFAERLGAAGDIFARHASAIEARYCRPVAFGTVAAAVVEGLAR